MCAARLRERLIGTAYRRDEFQSNALREISGEDAAKRRIVLDVQHSRRTHNPPPPDTHTATAFSMVEG
jgi:hypothetical protein